MNEEQLAAIEAAVSEEQLAAIEAAVSEAVDGIRKAAEGIVRAFSEPDVRRAMVAAGFLSPEDERVLARAWKRRNRTALK